MAITLAGSIVVLAAVVPAQASPCEASAQTVTRAAGAWSFPSGPIVTVAVEESGVSWAIGPGSVLDHVILEYAPVETEGATVSAAVTLPGSPTGVMPIEGDGDVTLRFVGAVCGDEKPGDDIVVDFEPKAPDAAVESVGSRTTGAVSAPAPAAASDDDAALLAVAVRRMCRFVTLAA